MPHLCWKIQKKKAMDPTDWLRDEKIERFEGLNHTAHASCAPFAEPSCRCFMAAEDSLVDARWNNGPIAKFFSLSSSSSIVNHGGRESTFAWSSKLTCS